MEKGIFMQFLSLTFLYFAHISSPHMFLDFKKQIFEAGS